MLQESLRFPSGWSEESEGDVVGCPDHLEHRAESHTWCNQREGKFLVCTGALGPLCSLIVSLTLIHFSHHILVILSHQHRAAHPLPGFIQGGPAWTCLGQEVMASLGVQG